ncbi:MAG: hypothetical protein SVU32_09670 [Candidatus Nanohaloarchaea archaeon]|nr:hypothetical protein [Candidatus Nanohaloarchaea archaeon]
MTSRQGFTVSLKLLVGAFLMIVILLFVIMFANSLLGKGANLMDMFSVGSYIPGVGQ